LGLLQKALAHGWLIGKFAAQQMDEYRPMQALIISPIDHRQTACPQAIFNTITTLEWW
jgi:hypothetical protein